MYDVVIQVEPYFNYLVIYFSSNIQRSVETDRFGLVIFMDWFKLKMLKIDFLYHFG
jgi:hypothetical protein